jgi:hypothetical protein
MPLFPRRDFLFLVPDDYQGTNLIDRGQFNACIYTLATFQVCTLAARLHVVVSWT